MVSPDAIVRDQAKKLGGTWRMGRDNVPVVILTSEEAENVIAKLEMQDYPKTEDEELKMLFKDAVQYYWRTDLRLGKNIFVLISNDPKEPSEKDVLIGTMNSTAMAEDVVHTHNAALTKFGRRYLGVLQSEES